MQKFFCLLLKISMFTLPRTFFSGRIYFGMPLKNQAPLFFHISLVSAQIRQRNCFCALPCLWTILWTPARSWANLMTRNELRDEVVSSFPSPFPFDGLSLVASMPHFWQIYLRQSLQRFALAPSTAPNFSPQSAQEQTQRAPPEHRLPQPRLSFDLVDVTTHTFRFIFSSLSTSLPTRSCSDRSRASALCITCENTYLEPKIGIDLIPTKLIERHCAMNTHFFLRIWKLISHFLLILQFRLYSNLKNGLYRPIQVLNFLFAITSIRSNLIFCNTKKI